MKILLKILPLSLLLLLSHGCKNPVPKLPNSLSFKQGNSDGCTTAKGDYKKNSKVFRTNADYYNGWFYGRRNCNISK